MVSHLIVNTSKPYNKGETDGAEEEVMHTPETRWLTISDFLKGNPRLISRNRLYQLIRIRPYRM